MLNNVKWQDIMLCIVILSAVGLFAIMISVAILIAVAK